MEDKEQKVAMMKNTLGNGRPGVFHLFFPSLSFLSVNLFPASDWSDRSDKRTNAMIDR